MSELTPCNYCTYQWFLRKLNTNEEARLAPCSDELGGTNLYILPKGLEVDLEKQTAVAWFWELTDYCAC